MRCGRCRQPLIVCDCKGLSDCDKRSPNVIEVTLGEEASTQEPPLFARARPGGKRKRCTAYQQFVRDNFDRIAVDLGTRSLIDINRRIAQLWNAEDVPRPIRAAPRVTRATARVTRSMARVTRAMARGARSVHK